MNTRYVFGGLFLLIVFCIGIVNISKADFYCDKAGKKYHTEGCKKIPGIQKRYLSVYKTESEAKARGYYPCQICLPPVARDIEISKIRKRHSLPIKKTQVFIGDSKSKVCHQSWCPLVQKIKSRDKVVFTDIDNAWKKHYIPCKECHPPVKPRKQVIIDEKEEDKEKTDEQKFIKPEME